MAVVETSSSLFHSPYAGDTVPDPGLRAGRVILATGSVSNAADDNNLSMYHLADLPADCLLHEDTFFDVTNLGFADVRIGTRDTVDALVSQTQASENLITPVAQGDANHGKHLWEVLGMAADPGGWIALYQHAVADAASAGSMKFRFAYLYH